MDAVGRVADAVLESIADDAPPPRRGGRDPQLPACGLQSIEQGEEADARLDQGVTELLVDLEHSIHPLQVEDDTAPEHRRGAAVGEIATGGHRPQRNSVAARDLHDGLDFFRGFRSDAGGCGMRVGIARRKGIQVGVAILLRHQHPLFADRFREASQGALEVGGADARGQYGGLRHGAP